jgi:hypothetical protein
LISLWVTSNFKVRFGVFLDKQVKPLMHGVHVEFLVRVFQKERRERDESGQCAVWTFGLG